MLKLTSNFLNKSMSRESDNLNKFHTTSSKPHFLFEKLWQVDNLLLSSLNLGSSNICIYSNRRSFRIKPRVRINNLNWHHESERTQQQPPLSLIADSSESLPVVVLGFSVIIGPTAGWMFLKLLMMGAGWASLCLEGDWEDDSDMAEN